MNNKTKTITLIGLMAALICVLGPISLPLPFSPVPISMHTFVVFIAVFALGMKKGTISYLIYLLIGLVGVPVFSGYTSGPGKLLGPTGGYLIGFIFMALIAGFFMEKWNNKMVITFGGMVLGCIVCYVFGSAWLAFQGHMSFGAAMGAGVIPFIPGDLVKMVLALLLGSQVRKRLIAANLV